MIKLPPSLKIVVFFRYTVLYVAFFLSCTLGAFAQTIWTNGAGDGDWTNPANWMGGVQPGAASTITFSAGTYSISSNIPNTLFGQIVSNTANVTFNQSGALLRTTQWSHSGGSIAISAGMTLQIEPGPASSFTSPAGTNVAGKIIIINSATANGIPAGLEILNGGELVVTDSPTINFTPTYLSGSQLTYTGTIPKMSANTEFPATLPAGVTATNNNSGGISFATPRTIMSSTLILKHGSQITLNANFNVNSSGKVQIEGAPILSGSSNFSYAGALDVLEYIGTGNYTVGQELPALVTNVSTMDGSILINKPSGIVNGFPTGTLRVNGSFSLNQGTWNVNAGGRLLLAGSGTTYYTTTSASVLNVNSGAVLEIGSNIPLTNNGSLNIADGASCILNDAATVQGANAINYAATTSTLRYVGSVSKTTTPQEIPANMPGGIMIYNSIALNLSSSISIMGAVTVGSVSAPYTGQLNIGSNTLTLNGNSLLDKGGIQVGNGGVLKIMNGVNVSISNPGTTLDVLSGGTLQFDGSGEAIAASPLFLTTYSPGSNLLYTGSGNRTVTSAEMPASGSINCNVKVNKTPGTYLDLPPSAGSIITLNTPATLSLVGGTVRAGREVRSILAIDNSDTAAVTSVSGSVEGPLRRTLAPGPNQYVFQMSDGGQPLPLAFINPMMSSPIVLTVEATNGNCGGTAGNNLTTISPSEYWRVRVASGSLISAAVAVFRPSGWTAPAAIGMADILSNGQYNAVGGTARTNGILSNRIDMSSWGTAQRFFAVGTATLPVKAAFGYQVTLNGVNQEAVAPANALYDALTSFTVEALVRPTWSPGAPGGDPCLFSVGDASGTNFSLHVGKAYSTIKVGNGTSAPMTVIPAGTFVPNTYSHIAAVYSGGVLTYYVDGKVVGSQNIGFTPVAGRSLHIGSNSGVSEFWQGDIDEVRFWSTAVPQNVIAAWKGREVTAVHPNVISGNQIGYWRFNDGYTQSAADVTPTANTALFANAPLWSDGSTTASFVATPFGTSTWQLSAAKVGAGTLTYSLIGANGGSMRATVTATSSGAVSYTPNVSVNLDDIDYVLYQVSDGVNVSTATMEVRFTPYLQASTQFVSHNRPTQINTVSVVGGVSPLTVTWPSVAGGLSPTTVTNPTVTLTTDATVTVQITGGFGNTASTNVPLLIKPLTLAFSHISTTATAGLPSSVISGRSFDLRYGVFDVRTGLPDTVSATVAMSIQPTAGGTAQFAVQGVSDTVNGNYVKTLTDRDRISENPFAITWLNAPIAGGSTEAVVSLFRTSGAPMQPVTKLITISTSATLPVITSFTPDSTGVGKTVVINGVNFVNVMQVSFGGVAAQSYVVDSPTRITAIVGAGANGPIGVVTAGGSVSSVQNFTFVPAPQVTSFTPTVGFQGSVVNITGQNFVAPATVSFGGVSSANVNVISPTQLFAEVGNGASGTVSVQTVGGTATSVSAFTFSGAPTITSISPIKGGARTVITVQGTDFQSLDSISIGFTKLTGANGTATLISGTEIRIVLDTVPLSGVVTVFMPNGSATSTSAFTFVLPPKIDSIIPAVGGAGTAVRLVGRNFENVDTVRFDNISIAGFMTLSTTAISFTMPPQMQNITSGVVVSALGGRDSSQATFQYVLPPQITAIPPPSGAGVWVQVTGANLVGVSIVRFGGFPADSVQNISPELVLAKVSTISASGPVSIIAAGGTVTSMQNFRFVFPPTITSFSPQSGTTGATVEITGTEFINVDSVSIGGVPVANFSVASDTQIVAKLSDTAASGIIRVTTKQGQASSSTEFQIIVQTVIAPPKIDSIIPAVGGAGTLVHLVGQNFVNVDTVRFGNVPIAGFMTLSTNAITFTMPEQVQNITSKIIVSAFGGRDTSSGTFQYVLPPEITDFPPTAGAGKWVQITGENLVQVSSVSFGGTPADSVENISPELVRAKVSSIGASGRIKIVAAGGTVTSQENFRFVLPPTITNFSPSSGTTGASVEIRGKEFVNVSGVSIGGIPQANYLVISDSLIVTTLSANAASGTIVVTTEQGQASSATEFQVIIYTYNPPPKIDSIIPALGGAGTLVRLVGQNFVNVDSLWFGGVYIGRGTTLSPTELNFTMPTQMENSTSAIVISAIGGRDTSRGTFQYVLPPKITAIPLASGAGKWVLVTGANLVGVSSVSFGSFPADSLQNISSELVRAKVSTSGASGPVTIVAAGGRDTSEQNFRFVFPPTITGFSPPSGAAGARIEITGKEFVNVTGVSIGGTPAATFNVVSDTLIVVKLSDTAISGGTIFVTTEQGQVSSATDFQVIKYDSVPPPKIDSIIPTVGGAGTLVRLVGRHFVNVDSLRYGEVNIASSMKLSTTAITFVMPEQLQASTSAIIVFALGGRDTSSAKFQYVLPPQITSFTPSGGAGAWVEVTGANFVGVTSVRFGGTKADSIQLLSLSRLRAKVAASGASGKIDVIAAGGTARSTQDFRFLLPPTITAFSPPSGARGSSVEILGTDFVNVSGVSIGGILVKNFGVISDTKIVAILSDSATTGTIRVTTQQGQASSMAAFQVVTMLGLPPSILSFAPLSGKAGTEVYISGQNLANTSLVQFAGITAATFRNISPTVVYAIVPTGATSGSVRITTPNGVASSLQVFQFIAPSDSIVVLTPLQRDSIVLVRFYNQTNGRQWLNVSNWLTAAPVSSWAGVTVENGQVTRLELADNRLLGTLPSFLAELPALKVLDLSGNQLSGSISSSIATIKTLETLRLRGNQLSGRLPSLAALTNLQALNVGNNRLSGAIPNSICTLPNLLRIRLDSNLFTGSIPACLGALQKVEILNLSENLLSDTIPLEIGSMTALRELSLSGNQLTGGIPQTLGTQATITRLGQFDPKNSTSLQATPNLQQLDLSRNRLTGTIPSSLGQCIQLQTLNLAQNRLTGNIPQSFGNFVALQSLDASRNQLSGTLPTFWGNLRQLQTLSLRSNAISGAVPVEIGRLSALTTMWLDSNALVSLTDSVQNLTALRRFSLANNRLKSLPALRRTSGAGFDSVNVADNALTFESLERNFTGTRVAIYSPQDSVLTPLDTTVRVLLPLRISSTVPGIANTYQWYKDGRVLALANDSVLSLTRLVRADTGAYTCYVRNSLARNLTLFRRTVRVRALPPQAPSERPTLLTPQNAAQSVSITPTFVWTTTALTSSYDVEISPTSDFSSPSTLRLIAADPLRPRLTLTSAQARENLTTYYWRVRAVSEGLPGAWSETGRFTTIPAGSTMNVETQDFGRVVLGKTSQKLMTIQNLSNVAIIIQTVRIVDPPSQSAGQFALTPLPMPVPLEPDSTMTVPVRFTPSAVGGQVATVVVGYSVASSGTNIPTELTFASVLLGSGGALTITGAGAEVDLGTILPGNSRPEGIQISNAGNVTMTIQPKPTPYSADTSRAKFRLSDALSAPLPLLPGKSHSLLVNCSLEATADTGTVRGGIQFVGQFTTTRGILFDTLDVPMKVTIIKPRPNDVLIMPKLVSEQQGVAPGGIAVLTARLASINYSGKDKDSLTKLFRASKQSVYSAVITLNRQVLVPAEGETKLQISSVNGDLVTYTILPTSWTPVNGPVFFSVRCRVVAGSTNVTALRMNRFVWDTTKAVTNSEETRVIVQEDTSEVRFVAGISQAGGKRLITAVTTAILSVMQPNPITVSGTIVFTLFEQSAVQLVVVDAFGRVVKNLVAGVYAKGEHLAQMRVEDLPTGAYFVVLRTPDAVLTEQVQVRR